MFGILMYPSIFMYLCWATSKYFELKHGGNGYEELLPFYLSCYFTEISKEKMRGAAQGIWSQSTVQCSRWRAGKYLLFSRDLKLLEQSGECWIRGFSFFLFFFFFLFCFLLCISLVNDLQMETKLILILFVCLVTPGHIWHLIVSTMILKHF